MPWMPRHLLYILYNVDPRQRAEGHRRNDDAQTIYIHIVSILYSTTPLHKIRVSEKEGERDVYIENLCGR